ncbi:hypothetical protein [Rhodococcus sp. 27YEA15]|uniref:hypothetical protein n=1 Tax=Rhodococcus sp. 27YEA15 TaxID=3156259 RepID=UPI003C7B0F6D
MEESIHEIVVEQDSLVGAWTGAGARAAAARVMGEKRLADRVTSSLRALANDYSSGVGALEAAREHLLSLTIDVTRRGFTVRDNGVVDASEKLAQFPKEPAVQVELARMRIEKEACEATIKVVEALKECDSIATAAIGMIRASTDLLERSAQAATPGEVVVRDDGGFSWRPDVPATAAASVVGVMTDATGRGLASGAASVGDDVARSIGKGLGPFGAVLGAVPAIANDINGGMDPTKAVVSEGAGAGVGLWFGGVSGSFLSSAAAGALGGSAVAPGVGTAVGFVAGAVVSGGVAFGVSKGVQFVWDTIF